MDLTIEIGREEDGRWIAEVLELPGVTVYGETQEQAVTRVVSLALRVLADKVEEGEAVKLPWAFSFLGGEI
jgi:predicted RNase H-like HicB family nuclease